MLARYAKPQPLRSPTSRLTLFSPLEYPLLPFFQECPFVGDQVAKLSRSLYESIEGLWFQLTRFHVFFVYDYAAQKGPTFSVSIFA